MPIPSFPRYVAGWEVSAGIGVESQITSGVVKGVHKVVANSSGSYVNNKLSAAKTKTILDMHVELTGAWNLCESGATDSYEASNTDLALVETEVADVFALRLKARDANAPLVANQMRPNADIPKNCYSRGVNFHNL